MPDDVSTQVIAFQVKGERKAADSIENLSAELVKARAETARLQKETRTLARGYDQSEKEFKQAAKVTHDLIRAKQIQIGIERKLKSAIDATGEAAKKQLALERRQLQQAGSKARLYGDVESRGRALTGALGYIGGAGGQAIERKLNIGTEVLASVEAVGLLKQELPQMTANLIEGAGGIGKLAASAGIVGLAAGALIVTYQSLSSESKRAAEEMQVWLDAIQQYSELNPSKMTTEQLQEEINKRIELGSQLSAEATIVSDRIRALEAEQSALDKITDKVGLFDDELEKARDRYTKLTGAIQSGMEVRHLLEDALDDGAIAANDAAAAADELREAEEELAEKREEQARNIISDVDARYARETEYNKRALSWTSDQIDKREEQIALERAGLEDFQDTLDDQLAAGVITKKAYDDARQSVIDRIDLLDEETAALNNMRPFVQVREAEKKAIEDAKKALEDRVADIEDERAAMEKRADALKKFIEDSVKLEEDRGRQVAEAAEDWAIKQSRDLGKHYADLAGLDKDFYADRAALLETITDVTTEGVQERLDEAKEYNRDSERAAEDHQKNLENILRTGRRAESKAARALDAVALNDARQAKEDALEEAEDQYTTEQQRREEDYQERIALLEREKSERLQDARDKLAELERNYRDERAGRIAAFDQKQREEEADRQLTAQRQRAAWQREDEARRAALANQLGITQQALDGILNTSISKWGSLQNVFSNGMNELLAIVQRNFTLAMMQAMGAVQDAIAGSPHQDQRRGGPQAPDLGVFGSGASRGLSDLTFAGATARGGASSGGGTQISATIQINGAGDPDAVAQAVRREIIAIAGGI